MKTPADHPLFVYRSLACCAWLSCLLLSCGATREPASPAVPAAAATRAPAPPAPAPAAPASSSAPELQCPRAMALDAAAIDAEVACLLYHYVRLDTTNPPGNELAAARFLQGILKRDGIASQIIESAPGRANLMARIDGKADGDALMLMHHMDVVPANAAEWSVPPFSATVTDGELWGRGSFDNKGAGVVHLMTLMLLQRLGMVPAHDVVMLAVADEENGGGLGARWLTEHRSERFEDVAYVLNEGGGQLQLKPDAVVYSVEVAQKAPLWLKLTARGRSGHGSTPEKDAASKTLVRALARLADFEFPIKVLPEVQAVFSQRAQAMPEGARAKYQDLQRSLADEKFRNQFLENARDAALVRNTLSITMLEGSDKENVVSDSASAVLDIRLLPGEDAERVRAGLVEVMAEPSVEVETLLGWTAQSSSADSELFTAIQALAASRHPNAPVAANVIGSFTDCNAFRALGKTCYGFVPVEVTLEDIRRIHGKDERIQLAALGQGVLDMISLVGFLDPSAPGEAANVETPPSKVMTP